MRIVSVQTVRQTQLVDITPAMRDQVEGSAGSVATVFVPHTTAGIVIQASGVGATMVTADLESALRRIVDESWDWQHTDEGDRNPWSHVRAALTASSVTIPLIDGKLVLGQLQSIFLCEFDGPRMRQVYVVVH